MLIILCCGDRDWDDYEIIFKTLKKLNKHMYHRDILVVDGKARGADTLANKAAKKLRYQWSRFPAKWNKYHKAAGPIRNQEMLDKAKPDIVLAFHKNIKKSKGTKDMVNRARKAGIPTCIFPQKRIA